MCVGFEELLQHIFPSMAHEELMKRCCIN